jgi:hypothetical protein
MHYYLLYSLCWLCPPHMASASGLGTRTVPHFRCLVIVTNSSLCQPVTASADLIPSARNVLYKIQAKYYNVGVGNVQIVN